MRPMHAAFLVASAIALIAACPALAQPLEAPSRVSAVTVYPDSARVSRTAEVDLPAGATNIVFRGLPVALDPASLRVEGAGAAAISISSAQTRVAPADAPAPQGSISARLRELRDREKAAETRIEALEGRRAMVQRFAEAGPDRPGSPAGGLDVAKWGEAWEAVGRELARGGEDIRIARAALAQIQEDIRALEASHRGPAGAQPAREVVVDLEAAAATRARITITYQVRGAFWRPAYDVRVAAERGKADVELVRRAVIRQRTGEDWTGVELAVSTSRPGRNAKAPDVHTQRVGFLEASIAAQTQTQAQTRPPADAPLRQRTFAAPPQPAPAAAPAVEQEATLEAGDYDAQFRIPGRVDVAGDGSERSLRIGSSTNPAELSVRIAPALDQTAYLEAVIVNAGEAPLLPGEASIQRNGTLVGRTRLEFVAPGARTRIGMGADDRVKVERKPVIRKENEPTWLGATRQETREFRTTVQNLHPFPVKALVLDRTPVSEVNTIGVELLAATTPPTDKQVEGRRGVLGWSMDLAPGETREVRLAYRLRWPADREIVFDTPPDRPEPR